ncbi:uncharacterized protein LOC124185612 isoform X1 [Neodiprion fabricii]|uniref:uncharacterized protein LOC124185612 isoform X1 n=1 Tax=Neodiprion fabricii TaxID=2872261 RepID=UPI001ED95E2D|nr:uncharacterized protein LOC124185612 isoform X1 [Neodiprion fabricii]
MQTTMCQTMDCRCQKSTRTRNTWASRLLLFAIFNLWAVQQVQSMPSRDVTELDSFSRTRIPVESHRRNPEVRETTSNNRVRSRGETIPESRRNSGNINFPEEDVNHRNTSTRFTVPVRMKSCTGQTYCEEVESYPEDIVRSVLRRNENLKIFAGIDEIQIDHRLNPSEGTESLCNAEVRVIFPKEGETDTGDRLLILQDPASGFKQGVQIESCGTGQNGGACKIIDKAILGYKTECTQKYVYRVMAALSKDMKGEKARVKMPSSCCCQIQFVGSRIGGRIGIDKDQSPAQYTKTSHSRRN